jgi:hypothetical protein
VQTTIGTIDDGDIMVGVDGAPDRFVDVQMSVGATMNNAGEVTLLGFSGGMTVAVETLTGTSDTLDGDNLVVLVDDDTAGSTVTITLPAAASNDGRVYHIKKLGTTANVIIDGNASETIDGETTFTLTIQYESIKLVCDGSNWSIL